MVATPTLGAPVPVPTGGGTTTVGVLGTPGTVELT